VEFGGVAFTSSYRGEHFLTFTHNATHTGLRNPSLISTLLGWRHDSFPRKRVMARKKKGAKSRRPPPLSQLRRHPPPEMSRLRRQLRPARAAMRPVRFPHACFHPVGA